MATCTTISVASKEKAYDMVAHYFIYFVSCNQYNMCNVTKAPPSKCNNATNRKALWSAIDYAKNRNADFLRSLSNLACNFQLNGDHGTIHEQARETALQLIDINRVADQVKCGYRGGGGKDLFDLNNFLGLGKYGIYMVGGAFFFMMMMARR